MKRLTPARKPVLSSKAAELRGRAELKLQAVGAPQQGRLMTDELRRRAAAQLRERRKSQRSKAQAANSTADNARLLHELQVHQVELELQNAELQEARDRMERLLEKYTDLYDFAPVGYFSLDEQGRILEANLTGAALLGVERARLLNRRLPPFLVPASRPVFLSFLERVFAGTEEEVCCAALAKEDAAILWASFHGTSTRSAGAPPTCCRVAVSDITSLKQAEETHRRMEDLAVSNRELQREIVRRQGVEEALRKSKRHQTGLVEQSHQMQEQLRHLSHQILQAQEEERKRISRELHDEITQTLVGINVRLASLARQAKLEPERLRQQLAHTQRLVEKSVNSVRQFARELRPSTLDDLGLSSTLQSFLKEFIKETGICVRFTTFAGVDQLHSDARTVLFRVVQSALTNVAKHAHASSVEVSIRKLRDRVCLRITDDGRSFVVARVLSAKGRKRLGLLGMRERVEMLGGTFGIVSAPGQGTTVLARIPHSDVRRRRPSRSRHSGRGPTPSTGSRMRTSSDRAQAAFK
ncbi:MAG TPA: histidine kinase [Candidatus Saccharimonadales bacterium]|nr:histidine kinase [Candidatus Saccharimonadales bacterium]